MMSGRWRERWVRLFATLRRRDHAADLDAEFESHVTLAAEELERLGLGPAEARRRAEASFGSRLSAREAAADAARVSWLETLGADLWSAVRALRATPAFSVAAVAMLAVGIGVNVAVFTVVGATLFKGYRGVPDNDRLVYVTTGRDCCLSRLDLDDWRAASTLTGLAAVADRRIAIQTTESTASETTTASMVTTNTFEVLGVAPALGRDFVAADGAAGAPAVAILDDGYWRSHLAADPGVVGRQVRIDGEATTVVGVMPPRFAFPQSQSLWMPLQPMPEPEPRNARGLWFAVGRLASGTTMDQARAELEAIGARMAAEHSDTNARTRVVVQTFRSLFFGPSVATVYGALWGAVGLVLLVACANLANLMLARATNRGREVALRLTLGAPRSRIVRQLLFESLLLSTLGGALGAWLASLAIQGYQAVAVPPTQPWANQLVDYAMDARVALYLGLVAVATAVLAGGLPAWRLSSVDVHGALRDGGRGAIGSTGRRRITNAIVTAQVALAVVLLAGAGVLVRSVLTVYTRDIGFDPSHTVVSLTMSLPAHRYPDEPARRAFHDRLLGGVRALPTVEAVGFSDGLIGQSARRLSIEVDGAPVAGVAEPPTARVTGIAGDYFAALGTTALSGRVLSASDDGPGDTTIAVVNRRLAEQLWPGADPIGRRLRAHDGQKIGDWRRVVGVVPNLNQGDPARGEAEPTAYVPIGHAPGRGLWLLVRTTAAPASLVAPLRSAIQAADPELPIWLGPYPLTDWIAGNQWRRGVYSGLLTAFAGLALCLAGAGIFAVLAGAVAQRRQEIGVRMAIGAGRGDVLKMVLREGLTPVVAGLLVGLVAAIGTNRMLVAQLVDVTPADPLALVGAAATLLAAAVVGCVVPARRAARVDPLIALRHD